MFSISFQSAFVFLVSGNKVLDTSNAPGAAIREATTKWLAGIPKLIYAAKTLPATVAKPPLNLN